MKASSAAVVDAQEVAGITHKPEAILRSRDPGEAQRLVEVRRRTKDRVRLRRR